MVRPTFALSEANVDDVVAICQRLQGLPLAIELAAARIRVMPIGTLRTKLASVVGLQRPDRRQGATSPGPSRHHRVELQAPSPTTSGALRALGAFAGGVALDDFTVVTGGVSPADPFDEVGSLADVGLVRVSEDVLGEPRVEVLEMVSEFALHELRRAGEEDVVRRRHALHYLDLVKRCHTDYHSGGGARAAGRVAIESDNVRAALAWTLTEDVAQPDRAWIGVQLTAAMGFWWNQQGTMSEGRRWVTRALELGASEDSAERAALLAVGAEMIGGHLLEGARAEEILRSSLAMSRRVGDDAGASRRLATLTRLLAGTERTEEAKQASVESVALARRSGDHTALIYALMWSAESLALSGSVDQALTTFGEVKGVAEAHGSEPGIAWAEWSSAVVLARRGDIDQALGRLRGIAPEVLRSGHAMLFTLFPAACSTVFALAGDPQSSATMLGAHWGQILRTGGEVDLETEEIWLEEADIALARAAVDAEVWQEALELGRQMTVEQAVAHVFG